MRFDKPIFFQKLVPGEYNPATGNYESDKIEETKKYASVTSAGVETLDLIYGELRQGSFVVRLQSIHSYAFDRIRIGQKLYRIDFQRQLRTKQVFVVSEVQ